MRTLCNPFLPIIRADDAIIRADEPHAHALRGVTGLEEKTMKILLLNPPTPDNRAFIREGRCNQEQGVWSTLWPPITLATAGAMLEAGGHDVEILDCAAQEIPLPDILQRIRQGHYRWIVWSVATPSIKSDLSLADEIKEIRPDIKTGVLGTHVTALAEQCLRESESLDFIIRNEPEESLAALADALENRDNIADINGISYKEADGQIFHNPPRAFIRDLDSLPFPAWHLLDLERYKLPLMGEKFLILSPVRGCPYPCTFCTARTYYGKGLRRRSVSKMTDEIAYNMERFGIKHFFIWADTFTADRNYVMQFCRQIREKKLDIGWTCNSRVDTVDQEMLSAMADAGCWMISYGIESGNQQILDQIKKKITLAQSREAVKAATNAGIRTAGHFVIGFPGETEESLRETTDFALSLNPEIAQFYCAVPFPGSQLYEQAANQGWIDRREFAEFHQDNAVMNLPGLPPSVVNDYRKKAYLKFYLRPSRFLQVLKLMKLGRIGETIKGGIRFIKWAGTPRLKTDSGILQKNKGGCQGRPGPS